MSSTKRKQAVKVTEPEPHVFNSPASPYLSRKFLAMIGGIFVAVGGILTGTLQLQEALQSIANIVIAYIIAEGAGDVAGRWQGE